MIVIKTKLISINILLLLVGVVLFWHNTSTVQAVKKLDITAYIFNNKNEDIPNGEYDIRFAIYTTDRTKTDAYPSNADAGRRVWEETQKVEIQNGVINAFLGEKNLLPADLNFSTSDYYIGIRINTDSEMVPRKKIGAVPLAADSYSVSGATLGNKEGNLVQLSKGGKLDEKILPTITTLGVVSTGAWEGDIITNNFLATALTGKTYNGLVLTANLDGFSLEGGTTARTLTVTGSSINLNQSLQTTDTPTFATLDTGQGAYELYAMDQNVRTTDTPTFAGLTLNGTLAISETGATPTFYTTFQGGDQSADVTYTLPTGTPAGNDYVLTSAIDGTISWQSVSGTGGTTGTGVAGQVAYWSGASSLVGENQLNVSRGGTGLNGSTAANGQLLLGNGTGYTLANLTSTDTSIVITNGSGTINLASSLGTSINLTSEVTGTLPIANGGTGATTLNDLIALGTHTTGNYVAGLAAGTAITVTGTAGEGWSPTVGVTADSIGDTQLTFNTGQHLTATSAPTFGGLTSNGALMIREEDVIPTFYTIFRGGDQSSHIAYTLPTALPVAADYFLTSAVDGTLTWELVTGGTTGTGVAGQVTYWSGASSLAGENQLNVSRGGTGMDTSASTGVPIITTGAWSVASSLSATLGGTGLTSYGTANQIIGMNAAGNALEYKTVSGTANQITVANAANSLTFSLPQDIATTSTPTLGGLTLSNLTVGSIAFAGAGGLISQDNANFFWDDTNNRLGIGTATPGMKLSVNNGSIGVSGSGSFFYAGSSSRSQIILNSAGGYGTIQNDAANTWSLGWRNSIADTLGTPVLSWNTTGNVGIGDTTPASLFTVGASDAFQINASGQITSGAWNGSTIAVAYGGTNTTAIGVPGSIPYSTGSAYAFSTGGTAGQILTSGGEGTPTWFMAVQGSILFAGVSGALQQDANFFWDNTNKYLGIGTSAPASQFEIYNSAANPVLTITGGDDSLYDPMIKFRTDATPTTKFSMGVDAGDGDKFKIYSGDGIGGTNEFSIDSTGKVSIANLDLGTFNFAADSGAVSWIDMSISGTPTIGTVESYTAQIDGNSLLTIYGEADGAGGMQNGGVGVGDTTPSYIFTVDHDRDGVNYAYVNNSNAWTSGSADYAEYFWSNSTNLQPGEVVCVDTKRENSVRRCEVAEDPDVMGIVSTNPAVLGNAPGEEHRENNPNYVAVGMLGQVPAKASAENGKISTGDSLTSASKAGYVMKANPGDSTVGVALQNLDKNDGVINVLISRKNKSLTVEEVETQVTDRIAQLSIQDQVNTLISNTMNSMDFQNRMALLESRTTDAESLATKLEGQIALISDDSILSFLKQLSETNLVDMSDKLNGILATGILDRKLKIDSLETSSLTIKNVDGERKTIGQTVICPAMFEAGNDGKCTVAQVDADNNGIDDVTKNPISDGKNINVATKATTETCKVFTAFESDPGASSWIEKTQDQDSGEYVGFKIKLSKEISAGVKVNWWIVEEK